MSPPMRTLMRFPRAAMMQTKASRAHATGPAYAKPQELDTALTNSATFLVCKVSNTPRATSRVRNILSGVADLSKNVGFRDQSANLVCTTGIGSDIWDDLMQQPRPRELRALPVYKGKDHATISTPGDLLFHIRANRVDLCFEFERQLLDSLDDSVEIVDRTSGFRYFDSRDLLGFVDGTANPVGTDASQSVFVTNQEDHSPTSMNGSYVVVQKYLHDLKGWQGLGVEVQESIIGRRKFDNVELDDAAGDQQKAHKTLASIEDENGEEHDILRDNMPFGSPASNEYGTYFIGYCKNLWVIEKMLERMFVGDPPGLHDRILNYSRPVTGTTFFAPSAGALASLVA